MDSFLHIISWIHLHIYHNHLLCPYQLPSLLLFYQFVYHSALLLTRRLGFLLMPLPCFFSTLKSLKRMDGYCYSKSYESCNIEFHIQMMQNIKFFQLHQVLLDLSAPEWYPSFALLQQDSEKKYISAVFLDRCPLAMHILFYKADKATGCYPNVPLLFLSMFCGRKVHNNKLLSSVGLYWCLHNH